MSKKNNYNDDDGRTIADMSGVGRDNLFFPRKHEKKVKEDDSANAGAPKAAEMSKKERRMYVLSAIKASLLIWLVFVVIFGLVIFLLLYFWR